MSEIRMLLDEIRDMKRRLQALETRQEHPGFAASDVARLSVANTFAGVQTIPNTGLHLLDTNASHDLIIAPGSNLTADRTLTVTTGDANRTLTLTGNATLNQDVSTAGSPAFAGLTVDTDTLFVDAANNRVGVATNAPRRALDVAGLVVFRSPSGTFSQMDIDYPGATLSTGAGFSAGALSPSYSSSGIFLSDSAFFIGNALLANGLLIAATNASGYIRFATGGTATGNERMRVTAGGNILINTTTDNGGKLQIDQSSTTAAIPTLRLNQADISEGFVDFIGTSAASAAGPISSWTVATIAGYVRVEINGAAFWMPYYNAPTA